MHGRTAQQPSKHCNHANAKFELLHEHTRRKILVNISKVIRGESKLVCLITHIMSLQDDVIRSLIRFVSSNCLLVKEFECDVFKKFEKMLYIRLDTHVTFVSHRASSGNTQDSAKR